MATAGERIAERYVLVAEIGAGGMGVVWRAKDDRLEREVAVKLLPASALGDPTARARLLREARATAQLVHPGIVHVYDVGDLPDGGAYLVMELVAGNNLRDLIDGDTPTATRIRWIVEIARALAHAHAAGVVHRDVKPDNVFVRPTGHPVLLDFGLAKPLPSAFAQTVEVSSQKSAHITAEGAVVGTPAYLAPEQVKGEPVGVAADQFALATMAFELLTRKLPWQGGTVLEVVASILRDAATRASEIDPSIPEPVVAALARGLEKSTTDRFPSVAAFADAIEGAVGPVSDPALRETMAADSSALQASLPSARSSGGRVSALASSVDDARIRATTGSGVISPEPIPPPPRPKRRGIVAIAVIVATLGGVGERQWARWHAPQPSADAAKKNDAASVHAIPDDAVVACPLFQASGDGLEGPTGWLGAAGAALACDRIGARLGAAPGKTLAPAELLPGTPREPTDQRRSDPFVAPDADSRIRAEARSRAQIIADGTIRRLPRTFEVEIVLRHVDGGEITRGSGHDVELYAAVSDAVRAMIPSRPASTFQREWLGAETTDAAVALLDLTNADLAEDHVDTLRRCHEVEGRNDVGPDMAFFVRSFCHELRTRTPLTEPPPPVVTSPPSALLTSVVAQGTRGGPAGTKKRIALLLDAREHTEEPVERALFAASAADLGFHIAQEANELGAVAHAAVHDWPRLVDLRGTPYHRLSFSTEFDEAVAEAEATWLPFEPIALLNAGGRTLPMTERIALGGRAYLMGPRGFFADSYGELLARSGKIEGARGVAEQSGHELLRVQILIADAKYKQAFELATRRIAQVPTADENSREVFRLSAAATEAALYTGHPRDFVDDVVKRFVDPEPPHVSAGLISYLDLVFACLEAPPSTAKRCVKRLKALYARGIPGGIAAEAPAIVAGAELWAAGDAHGAAKTWRPLLRDSGTWLTADLRHVLAESFDRGGMPELGVQVDADFVSLATLPGAMDLADVRAARRADRAGQKERAAQLAEVALKKWRLADEDVPMMKEMEELRRRNQAP